MGKKTVPIPGTNDVMEVDDTWDQPAVDAAVRRYQDWSAANPRGDIPQPPPEGTPDVRTYNPSTEESYLTQAGHMAEAALRGGGQTAAYIGDTLWNAPKMAYNDYLELMGQGTDPQGNSNYADYTTPVSNAYESSVPPAPVGYSGSEEFGRVAVPAAAEALLSEGTSLLRGRSSFGQFATRVPMRTARDVGLGIGGGAAGGEIAADIGGEKYRDLGTMLGGALVAGAGPKIATKAAGHVLMSPQSAGKVSTIDRANTGLPPEDQIPPTVGLVGSKAAGTLEDITGRGLGAQAAEQARRKQFSSMEKGVQRTAAEARGSPTTGKITPETIGADLEQTIASAKGKADNRVQQIQNDLESRIGSSSTVDVDQTLTELEKIATDKTVSAETRDHASLLANKIKRDTTTVTAGKGKNKRVISRTGLYGAIKDVRSEIGTTLTTEGQKLKKGVRKRGYGDLTSAMEDTAETQGVPRSEFQTKQAETKQLFHEQEVLDTLPGKTEAGTHQRTLGKGSTRQLQPLQKHTPDALVKSVADDVELRLRRGSAGDVISPDQFDPAAFEHWRTLSPQRKAIFARNNPSVIRKMDDLAEVGLMEESRSGKRTRPGRTGSSIGASWGLGLGQLGTAGSAGFLGHITEHPIAGSIAAATALLGPSVIGKVMTNPNVTRALVAAREQGLGNLLAKAVTRPSVGGAGAGLESPFRETSADRAERQRQQELINRALEAR